MKVWMPPALYSWIDNRGDFPIYLRKIWPFLHFCDGMDGLLIVGDVENCFCGLFEKEAEEARHKLIESLKHIKSSSPPLF